MVQEGENNRLLWESRGPQSGRGSPHVLEHGIAGEKSMFNGNSLFFWFCRDIVMC